MYKFMKKLSVCTLSWNHTHTQKTKKQPADIYQTSPQNSWVYSYLLSTGKYVDAYIWDGFSTKVLKSRYNISKVKQTEDK